MSKLLKYKKLLMVGLFAFSVLVNAGFFPIIQLNANNPVDLGIVMNLLILGMSIAFHGSIGAYEAALLPNWSVRAAGALNLGMVLGGLACRFLLEFGEVSNTYHFTAANVLFHTLLLSAIATVAFAENKKRVQEQQK